jgi:rare lipoprotein A
MFGKKENGSAEALLHRSNGASDDLRVLAGAAAILAACVIATSVPAEAAKARQSVPASAGVARTFSGIASYYGSESGSRTASGARYNPDGLTAAHRTLPFGTQVRVTEPRSGRSVVVTINDRGPFIRGRVLDLSVAAARTIGITGRGVGHVVAEVL